MGWGEVRWRGALSTGVRILDIGHGRNSATDLHVVLERVLSDPRVDGLCNLADTFDRLRIRERERQ